MLGWASSAITAVTRNAVNALCMVLPLRSSVQCDCELAGLGPEHVRPRIGPRRPRAEIGELAGRDERSFSATGRRHCGLEPQGPGIDVQVGFVDRHLVGAGIDDAGDLL